MFLLLQKGKGMDEKIINFIKRYQKILIASGLIGFLLTPFLWPFFLAIVYCTLRLALPIFLILLGIKLPYRYRYREPGRNDAKGMQETTNKECESKSNDKNERMDVNEQREKTTGESECKKTEPVSEPSKKETSEQGRRTGNGEKEQAALNWYLAEGRDGILRIAKRMEKEGFAGMSIQNDGLCFVKEAKGYRRVGAVRNFPEKQLGTIAAALKRDGIKYAAVNGRFILIFWKQEKGDKH